MSKSFSGSQFYFTLVTLLLATTFAMMAGCAGTQLSSLGQNEALVTVGEQVLIAKLIEQADDPKAAAAKVYDLASQELPVQIEELKAQIYQKFEYEKLDVSSQILIKTLIEALAADLSAASGPSPDGAMSQYQKALEQWRTAAKLAALRFL